MAVNCESFTNVAHLVGETNFQRMKRVAHILDHLGGLNIGLKQRRLDVPVKRANRGHSLLIVCANQSERRSVEVSQRSTLAQKFWIDANTKIQTSLFARSLLQSRHNHIL